MMTVPCSPMRAGLNVTRTPVRGTVTVEKGFTVRLFTIADICHCPLLACKASQQLARGLLASVQSEPARAAQIHQLRTAKK